MDLLKVLLVSMLPVAECRLAIPLGVLTYDLPVWIVYIVAVVGNLLPVPLIVLFGGRVLEFMAEFKKLGAPFRWIIKHGEHKAAKIRGALFVGLLTFVAIPLPGTGAWTGALIAITLRMRLRECMPAIGLGVIIAAAIMTFGSGAFSVLT